MKHDEMIVGQLVWWQIRRNPLTLRAAVVLMLPSQLPGFTGIAVRSPYSDGWYPKWVSSRMLTERSITTETIPAFFAAVAAWQRTKLERHYDHLTYVAQSLPAGHVAVLAQSSLAEMERAVGEFGLRFQRDDRGRARLVEMADCEVAAFIAAANAKGCEAAR